jgi:hypothetical protein
MTGGEERGPRAGLVSWAQDARVRSAACAAQAVSAAESAAAGGEQADRMIERVAERNPQYAEHLQAIIVTAARRRAAIARWRRSCAAGQRDGQLLPTAWNEPGVAAITEPEGHGRDMVIVQDRDRTVGEFQDTVTQGMFTAGLALQDAAELTMEPEVRWRIEAAADGLDELIRIIRGALFSSADRRPSRGAGSGTR